MIGHMSWTTPVRSRVPQGSVLDPCLFLTYMNDLPTYVDSNSQLFADDSAVDRVMMTAKDQVTLQSDLTSLSD